MWKRLKMTHPNQGRKETDNILSFSMYGCLEELGMLFASKK